MARRLTASPSPVWVGDLTVFERTLSNGLKALVLPRDHAPIVVCDLHYPVGSVDEPPGLSGLAHFVEHMLFKGTKRFPKGQIDRLAYLKAGHSNAETGEDLTHYWFAFPADRWEVALEVEADRMVNASFEPAEVEAERQVIAEERARELDSPIGRLDQTHLAVSYLVHPYRNPILGWPEDLRRITVQDLRSFYRAHYRPDGAVLVVVGSLDPHEALDRIEDRFSAIAPGAARRQPIPDSEPVQNGRREFTQADSEGVARGLFGWHTVPRFHPDAPALDVLSDLLSCGRRSRLWDRLVERRRTATWVDASHEDSRLSGQFLVQVESTSATEIAAIETEIREAIHTLGQAGPTPEELERSRNRIEASWRFEQEDLAGLAAGLGQVALWGPWQRWQAEHRAALAVRTDDVRRVASLYLTDSSLTVGWSLPHHGRAAIAVPRDLESAERPVLPPSVGLRAAPAGPLTVATRFEYRPLRVVLPNGLRILSEQRPGTGTVALDLFVDAGTLRESKPGLAHLTARLREEGTSTRSAEALAAAIEDVGGTMEIGSTGVSMRVRAEDLPLAVEILADVILRPSFPDEALPWIKRRIGVDLRGDRDDPAFRADLAFRSLIYGTHPYARDPRGTARQIASLTRADILEHQARLFGADNAFLVAVGDFETRFLRQLIKTHLSDWTPLGRRPVDPPSPVRSLRPRFRRIERPGEQVHLLLGHLGVARSDPDFDALVVLDHIFGGGPGFTDRLGRILRDELGLAYSVGGGITDTADAAPGLFRVYVGTSPAQASLALAAATEQIQAMHAGAFSDDEVNDAVRYLAASWVFDYQTVGQRVDRLLDLERLELPLDEPLLWPERLRLLTPRHIRLAARRHLVPSSLLTLALGPSLPANLPSRR